MKRLSLGILVLGASTLVACDGLKEALTAHVDVVARAGSQELSVTRLSDMLGNSKIGVPVNREIASLVADEGFWSLDAPIVRITAPHIPIPSAAALEDATIPSVDRIVAELDRICCPGSGIRDGLNRAGVGLRFRAASTSAEANARLGSAGLVNARPRRRCRCRQSCLQESR